LRRRWVFSLGAICAGLVLVAALTHSIWLTWLGSVLVSDMPPVKADAVLVLAGDPDGERIKKGGDLVRAGYVPKVLVSGPMEWYGVNEAELAIRFAAANGYPEEWFEGLNIRALSTEEEASAITPELERRGIRRLLLVTSNFHTARAGKIFRRAVPAAIEIRTIAAPDKYFAANTWWHTREGWKTWFYETTKTMARLVGI
jgi:uncharacterized SAM-binding protein YcdF (DUF218 family)